MTDLPTPKNCPIKNDNGVCMCACMPCAEVRYMHCSNMRTAYHYGMVTMETKEREKVEEIKQKIQELFPTEES